MKILGLFLIFCPFKVNNLDYDWSTILNSSEASKLFYRVAKDVAQKWTLKMLVYQRSKLDWRQKSSMKLSKLLKNENELEIKKLKWMQFIEFFGQVIHQRIKIQDSKAAAAKTLLKEKHKMTFDVTFRQEKNRIMWHPKAKKP